MFIFVEFLTLMLLERPNWIQLNIAMKVFQNISECCIWLYNGAFFKTVIGVLFIYILYRV